MKERIVSIRGHHLSMVYSKLFPGRGMTRKALDKATLELGYGEEVLEVERAIIEKMKKNSTVILVDGLDDICKKCPKKTDICSSEFGEEDKKYIQAFDLEVGKFYSGRLLIRKLRENKEIFQYARIPDRFWRKKEEG